MNVYANAYRTGTINLKERKDIYDGLERGK